MFGIDICHGQGPSGLTMADVLLGCAVRREDSNGREILAPHGGTASGEPRNRSRGASDEGVMDDSPLPALPALRLAILPAGGHARRLWNVEVVSFS